ncbi:hypothetical protein [Psychrobacter sp. W2-37-MNA-CIBAN-0211]|uniref:hypothetical protein n=1 Tax=Psychrobacter sp. W2-37-MNA-CIBAN-0211 TaxID=3140443 RepID=UPI0033344FAB
MLKKTKLITYNLGDRGRSEGLGTDRSDVSIQSMVERINASDTQELVASGDMYGYYGHELRGRFGMNPPDVWVNPESGESIRLEPAIRTIKLSADNDGNVTHQEEFLDTDNGKYSERLYANNAGGFSSAVMRKMGNAGKYDVTGFHGFDYVRQPNYHTNRGNGMFDAMFWSDEDVEMAFDSLTGLSPERVAMKAALETAIIHQYDSVATAINADTMIAHYQNEALVSQNALITRDKRQASLAKRQEERQEAIYDNLICPSVSFDEITAQWDNFANLGTSDADLRTTATAQQFFADKEHDQQRTHLFKRS